MDLALMFSVDANAIKVIEIIHLAVLRFVAYSVH